MRAYILQILGEKQQIEKEEVIECLKRMLPKDKNFTLHVAELSSLEVLGKEIKGTYI